jgi:hypothetical protein
MRSAVHWERIERILNKLSKQPGTHDSPRDIKLGDYAHFLQRFDGAEGFINPDHYLLLWGAKQISELNKAYSVLQFLPEGVLIGTDGDDAGFGISPTTGRYFSVPLVGMSPKAVRDMGASFEEFMERLAA